MAKILSVRGGRRQAFDRAIALPLALLFATSACKREGNARPAQRPPVPVVVGQAERRDVPQVVSAVGSVQAFVTVAVRPLVSGQIVRVLFRDGDEVRAGQQLFEIDPRPYQASLAQARANAARARRQAANAEADARRYAELVKKEYVTEQQYQTARATAAALDADVSAADAAVRRAELDLANCRIDAPVGGRTGAVLVQIGNVVQPSQANALVVIAQMRPILVSFTVPETNVGALRSGIGRMKATVDVPGGRPHEGTLTFVNNTADPASGTILARATFPNADEALWPGQFVNVRVVVGVDEGAVVAPASAIVTGQSGTFTFVVKDDQTVEQRPVKVARADAQQAVVADGLSPGERVVTDGQLGLEPGARVTAKPPVAPAGARAQDGSGPQGPARPRVQARQP